MGIWADRRFKNSVVPFEVDRSRGCGDLGVCLWSIGEHVHAVFVKGSSRHLREQDCRRDCGGLSVEGRGWEVGELFRREVSGSTGRYGDRSGRPSKGW